jgi:hypothetical protein
VSQHYNRREPRLRKEDLRKWFGKGKKGDWIRVGTDGEIKGDCAREPGEGKPKCMPRDKAHSMSKKDRASAARRKRAADPQTDRPGTGNKPIMVKTDKKKKNESIEMTEKNVPTNPALWSRIKAQAKSKFDVYPSAYANGWAAKKYKAAGGGWKTESVKEALDQLNQNFPNTLESLENKELPEMKTLESIRRGIEIAKKSGGAMTPAVKKIDKIKKNLSNNPRIQKQLRKANEEDGVDEAKVRDASKSATGYDIYHKTYSGAMQHAYAHAKKKHGVTVSSDEIDSKVASGPSKPSSGKTVSHILGTDKKKKLHVQVYNTGKSYELNMYVESVEEASIIKTVHKNVTNKKSAEKDRKKAVKTFKDIRKGKYPGVKIAKESVELDEATTVSRADFDKLKKGSMITIDYGSSIRGSTTRTFQVKSKTRSAKYNVDKVNMVDPKKPGGMKFHLYSRDGKDATLSLGDMGATINSYSIKESIEEYKKENPMVMNLKGKKVELLKTGSSFKPTFTLTVDGKEKGKFGSEKDAMKHFARMTKESVELDEATMSPSQVAQLKKAYGGIEKINPTGPAYKKAKAFIANMSKDELMTIAKAKIRWLSQFAASELARSHNVKLKAKDYMGEATYQGKKVPLNKPMAGDVKKSKVYVDPDGDGVAKKVNFGDKNMKIKKNIPARRKSFRARHNCDNPGPKDKARYWSCKAW